MSEELNPIACRTLDAAAARIVPEDDFPSAAQAGAVAYVRRLLDGDLRERRSEMAAGLAALDAAADGRFGASFFDLTADRKDAVLTEMQTGNDPVAARFIEWLIDLVLESFYADPANGGNAGAVSWQMVGYQPRVPGYDPATGNEGLR